MCEFVFSPHLPLLLGSAAIQIHQQSLLSPQKKIKFGTIDPNVGGWGRVVPNFYKSMFSWHI